MLRPARAKMGQTRDDSPVFCAIMVSCNIAVEVQKCMDNSSMDIDERKIVDEFKRIAFSGEKDSNACGRSVAGRQAGAQNSEDAVLRKLDEVLAEREVTVPLTEKQREFIARANHRWNVKVGAVRSGKTYGDYFLIPHRIRDPARTSSGGIVLLVGATTATVARNTLDPHAQNLGRGARGQAVVRRRRHNVRRKVRYCRRVKQRAGGENSGRKRQILLRRRGRPGRPIYFPMLQSRPDRPCSVFDGTCNPAGPSLVQKFLDSGGDIYTVKPIPLTTIPCCRPSLCARSKRVCRHSVV